MTAINQLPLSIIFANYSLDLNIRTSYGKFYGYPIFITFFQVETEYQNLHLEQLSATREIS